MTLVVYTTIVSPHILPFIEEVRRQCPGIEVKYITRGFVGLRPTEKIKIKRGWDKFGQLDYVIRAQDDWALTNRLLRECDILYCGFRETELFESRVKAGKLTYYNGERWLKPYDVFFSERVPSWIRERVRLPGILRLLVPNFRRMVRRFVKLTDSDKFVFLGIGVYAVRDFARLRRIFHGDWKCFFRCPEIPVERRLFSVVENCQQVRLWAYFVSPSLLLPGGRPVNMPSGGRCKLLWVGRMVYWKKVEAIVEAVKSSLDLSLTLLGGGEEEPALRKRAKGCDRIMFHEPVDLAGVRQLMREHDVLVLSSSIREGWGAVASEAIEEGRLVIGTYEAGSTATVLPKENLFHAGDADDFLRVVHSGKTSSVKPDGWSAAYAANVIIKDWSVRYGK